MTRMDEHPAETEGTEEEPRGNNTQSLINTLARIFVILEESGYALNRRQDTVLDHDVLPDPASEVSTREAN